MSVVEIARARRDLPEPALRRQYRKAAGLTAQAVADEIGVHRVTIMRWERGNRCPRGSDLVRYVALLDNLQAVMNA